MWGDDGLVGGRRMARVAFGVKALKQPLWHGPYIWECRVAPGPGLQRGPTLLVVIGKGVCHFYVTSL